MKLSYRQHMRVNAPRTWRQRLAGWLIELAARVDHNRTLLAVEFCGDATLPHDETVQCLRAGLRVAFDLYADAVLAELIEQGLRAECPELYTDQD